MKIKNILLLCLFPSLLLAQDPKRFEEEVSRFFDSSETYDVVFTGSSSMRLWETLSEDFPDTKLINTGFGGSQMQDLEFYVHDLVISYRPSKVFIYEGDNDISEGKTSRMILIKTRAVVDSLEKHIPGVKIHFISPKPSPSRWHLKARYESLNRQLKEFCEKSENIEFIDVWTPMLNEDAEPFPDIFIEDELHMNDKGYRIWMDTIRPYLD